MNQSDDVEDSGGDDVEDIRGDDVEDNSANSNFIQPRRSNRVKIPSKRLIGFV